MDFLQSLNPEQREAVQHVHGPLLILAGAGSGKTRVIVHRMAHLLALRHARPDELLAVTFTNKAAEQLRARVASLVGDDCDAMWVSTFHALCARLLRREAPAIGLTRDFVIYDSSDQLALMKQVLRELQVDDSLLPPRTALSRISHAKNTMEGPEALRADAAWSGRGEQLVRIHDRYTAALRDANALDFDDLLLETVRLFETAPAVRARYSERFRFVMVDEYQDTNRPQYLLVRQLSGHHRNLCVVGDPDQSIYKWRGADVRNILDFERDFPDAVVVQLEQNYRSTQTILDAATAVISRNRNRKPKRLWTDRKGGAPILAYRGADELDEAAFITRTARGGLAEVGDSAVAILYRTNAQSRVVEDALMREAIPYRIVGGVRFYERKEVKDALAYLKLVLNPHDDVSLRRIINVPARGIGKGVLDQLERLPAAPAAGADIPLLAGLAAPHATEAASPLWVRVGRAVDGGLLPARATASLAAFRDLLLALGEVARRETVSIAIGKILEQTGYLHDLRADPTEEAQARLDNLLELISAAREYEAREPEPALAGFVDRLSLLSDTDEEAGARDARVWLMTMHAAKGLEFPLVIIAGLDEGLFPHARAADQEGELDEERRLCYVAMTRARARLVLTGAARRRVFGEYQSVRPSRFLEEVPGELVESAQSPSLALTSAQRRFSYAGSQGPREPARFRYEEEDQSARPVSVGARVRHAHFGVGTVLSVEELHDDWKVVVRFAVGPKTLRAKYAKLEPA